VRKRQGGEKEVEKEKVRKKQQMRQRRAIDSSGESESMKAAMLSNGSLSL